MDLVFNALIVSLTQQSPCSCKIPNQRLQELWPHHLLVSPEDAAPLPTHRAVTGTQLGPLDPSHRVPLRAVGHTAAAGNILAKLPWKTWVLCSPCRPLLSLGCEWHRAGSQGHQGCLTRREVSHGEGFAWAAHRTQQVPSF